MAIDILTWHKPVDLSEVKHALEIEKELGRERALDGELILEEPEALDPARDPGQLFRTDDQLQQESAE